jgi:hypothetical protein
MSRKCPLRNEDYITMPEQAEDMILLNLVEALNRLHDDLDRVELWTAALSSFHYPVPEYRPAGDYLLPAWSPRRPRL